MTTNTNNSWNKLCKWTLKKPGLKIILFLKTREVIFRRSRQRSMILLLKKLKKRIKNSQNLIKNTKKGWSKKLRSQNTIGSLLNSNYTSKISISFHNRSMKLQHTEIHREISPKTIIYLAIIKRKMKRKNKKLNLLESIN